jgi:hypothetical protein
MTWNVKQIFAAMPPNTVDSMVNVELLHKLLLAFLCLCVSYPCLHLILDRCVGPYKVLPLDRKNIVIQHVVEAAFFTLTLPLITYFFLCFNFKQFDSIDAALAMMRDLSVLMYAFIFMYMIEIAMRFHTLNPLVLFHHLVTIGYTLTLLVFPTTAFLKAGVILVYFAWFEVLTFYGLIMNRFCPMHKATPRVIFSGIVLFGSTRIIQLAWFFVTFIGSWEEHVLWQAIFQCIMMIIISFVQLMALNIHYSVWRRCLARQLDFNPDPKGDKSDQLEVSIDTFPSANSCEDEELGKDNCSC